MTTAGKQNIDLSNSLLFDANGPASGICICVAICTAGGALSEDLVAIARYHQKRGDELLIAYEIPVDWPPDLAPFACQVNGLLAPQHKKLPASPAVRRFNEHLNRSDLVIYEYHFYYDLLETILTTTALSVFLHTGLISAHTPTAHKIDQEKLMYAGYADIVMAVSGAPIDELPVTDFLLLPPPHLDRYIPLFSKALKEGFARGKREPVIDIAYELSDDPLPVFYSNSCTYLRVRLTNTGTFPWLAPHHNPHPLAIGYRWYRGTSLISTFNVPRTVIHTEVRAGESLTILLQVATPEEPGEYILQLDIIREGIDWLSNLGVLPAEWEIFVTPEIDNTPRATVINGNCFGGDAVGSVVLRQIENLLAEGYSVLGLVETIDPRLSRIPTVTSNDTDKQGEEGAAHLVIISPEELRGDIPPRDESVRRARDHWLHSNLILYNYSTYYPLLETIAIAPSKARIMIDYFGVTPPRYWPTLEGRADVERGEAKRSLIVFADSAVTHSAFTAQELKEIGLPKEAISITPLGVSLEEFAQTERFAEGTTEAEIDQLRKQYGLSGRRVVLYTGRIAGNKRIDVLIDALAHLRTKGYADLSLVIVGDNTSGPYAPIAASLVEQAARNDLSKEVIFTGRVKGSIATFYRMAEIFCTASEHEGFCIPVIEAQAAGVPVVAAEATAIPETAGEGALYFRAGDSRAAAEMIARLLEDEGLRHRLRKTGRENAKRYSFDEANQSFRKAARQAVENPPRWISGKHHVTTEIVYAPASVSAGGFCTVKVKFRNSGRLPWRINSEENITIGHHWYAAKGNGASEGEAHRVFFPHTVKVGEEVEIMLTALVPERGGDYILRLELVSEGAYWFKERGGLPLDIPVTAIAPISDKKPTGTIILVGGERSIQSLATIWNELENEPREVILADGIEIPGIMVQHAIVLPSDKIDSTEARDFRRRVAKWIEQANVLIAIIAPGEPEENKEAIEFTEIIFTTEAPLVLIVTGEESLAKIPHLLLARADLIYSDDTRGLVMLRGRGYPEKRLIATLSEALKRCGGVVRDELNAETKRVINEPAVEIVRLQREVEKVILAQSLNRRERPTAEK